MKIATWNINGVKARIENLCQWLKDSDPDIACLQEIKSVDEGFPRGEIEALGYHGALTTTGFFDPKRYSVRIMTELAKRNLNTYPVEL